MTKKGLVQPLVLATILAVGFAAFWGVFGLWATETAAYLAAGEPPQRSLVFLADGTPLVAHQVGEYGGRQARCDSTRRPVLATPSA